MAFRYPILLVTALIVAFPPLKLHAQKTPTFSNDEYCITDDATFGLYRPKGWKVATQRYPNGRANEESICIERSPFVSERTSHLKVFHIS